MRQVKVVPSELLHNTSFGEVNLDNAEIKPKTIMERIVDRFNIFINIIREILIRDKHINYSFIV